MSERIEQRPRLWVVPLVLCGLAALYLAVTLARGRFVQMDEFVFVRAAWLVGGGEVPYRDFFDHHTPFFYSLLAPALTLLPERAETLVSARLLCLPLFGLLAFATYSLCRAWSSARAAACATILLVTLPAFVSRAIEVRPDLLAATLFIAAGALYASPRGDSTRGRFLLGVLIALSILSTQKAVHYCWGLGAIPFFLPLSEGQGQGPRPSPRRLRLALVAGVAAPLVLFVALLALLGAWSDFKSQNLDLAVRWQLADPGFSAAGYLREAMGTAPLWRVLTLAGLVVAVVRWLRARRGLSEPLPLRPLVVAVPAALSLLTIPIPWPYNFLAVFPALTPLSALAIEALEKSLKGRRAASLVLLIPALAVALEWSWWRGELRRDNAEQLLLVDDVLAATGDDEAVFDSNGGYLFRPSAYFLWYHSGAMRALLRRQFETELIPSIVGTGAAVWIADDRFSGLPPNVVHWVRAHYQRFRGPIHFWGQRLAPSAGADPTSFEIQFTAIRDGRYFLVGAGASPLSATTIVVDGIERAEREPFELAKGEHRVSVLAATNEQPFLLWLPRTGKVWVPESGPMTAALYPHFF